MKLLLPLALLLWSSAILTSAKTEPELTKNQNPEHSRGSNVLKEAYSSPRDLRRPHSRWKRNGFFGIGNVMKGIARTIDNMMHYGGNMVHKIMPQVMYGGWKPIYTSSVPQAGPLSKPPMQTGYSPPPPLPSPPASSSGSYGPSLSFSTPAGDSYGSPVKEPVVVIQTSGWKPITNPPRPAGVTSSLSSSYRPPASPAPHPATIQASFTPQQPISTVGYQPPPVGNNFAQPVGTSYQPSGITKQPSSYQPSSSTSYSPPQPISTGYTPGGITQQPFGSTFEPSQPNGFSSQPTSTVPLRPSDIYQPAGPTLTPSTPFLPNQPAVEATPDSYGVPESDPISVTSTKDTDLQGISFPGSDVHDHPVVTEEELELSHKNDPHYSDDPAHIMRVAMNRLYYGDLGPLKERAKALLGKKETLKQAARIKLQQQRQQPQHNGIKKLRFYRRVRRPLG